MILYEVTVTPAAEIREAFASYMREKHIRDVLDTGCFTGARFAAGTDGRYRTAYTAPDREHLDRYLRDHAPRLRDDFAVHFPAGVAVSRETWEVLEGWQEEA